MHTHAYTHTHTHTHMHTHTHTHTTHKHHTNTHTHTVTTAELSKYGKQKLRAYINTTTSLSPWQPHLCEGLNGGEGRALSPGVLAVLGPNLPVFDTSFISGLRNWSRDCSVTSIPQSRVFAQLPPLPSPSLPFPPPHLKDTTSCPGCVMLSLSTKAPGEAFSRTSSQPSLVRPVYTHWGEGGGGGEASYNH